MGLDSAFKKNKMKKPLAKNQPVNVNGRLHTNPSKIGWDPNFYDPGLFEKEPYGVIGA